MQTFISIFQSIGKSFIPFIVLSIGLIFRTLFVYILTSKININIFGGIIANILFLIISVILMAIWLKKYMNFEVDFFRNLLSPMIIGIFVFLFMTFSNWSLKSEINYFASMIITALIGLVVYLLAIYFGKTFTNKEKKYLNFKKKSFIKGKK